jgi:hypothetical protein
MRVKALRLGSEVSGLHIGHSNVRRHFPRNIKEIELQLDHLRIECGLTPDFWRSVPEIHDPRLRLWLASKNHAEKACRTSIPFVMIPSGEHSFKLEIAARKGENRNRYSPSSVAEARFF